MKNVRQLMEQAVEEGIFPGAVLLAVCDMEVVIHEAVGFLDQNHTHPVTTETIYDLASLTKPLATAACFMALTQMGRLSPQHALGDLHPGFSNVDKAPLSLEQILSHTAGFPAHRNYYQDLVKLPYPDRKAHLVHMLNQEPLEYPPGKGCIYSDLGYMVLGLALEHFSGATLDLLTDNLVFQPLAIKDLFFLPMGESPTTDSPLHGKEMIAPTEDCPWRKKVLHGQVHDDNAWALGGVAGHAGLFGTALGVWNFLKEITLYFHEEAARNLFTKEVVKHFVGQRRLPGTYVLGYDTPTPPESSSGRFYPATSIGHLGFTGVSFWLDIHRKCCVILLSNRVHPSRNNERIRIFRPIIHNAAMEAMGLS